MDPFSIKNFLNFFGILKKIVQLLLLLVLILKTFVTVSTCPWTKWPANSSPYLRDFSKLTRSPDFKCLKAEVKTVCLDK